MASPKILVLGGYGINCEEETQFAFTTAGGIAEVKHVNDVIENKNCLRDYQILALPGGFSFGDDTGSGKALANKLRNHLWEELVSFINRGNLAIGICNGFQVLANLGLLPALDCKYGEQTVALTHNTSARYECRWVELVTGGSSVWTKGLGTFEVPVAHGEGRFVTRMMDRVKYQVIFRYAKQGAPARGEFPYNPNGSLDDVAGICDISGRVLGMMPHPERHIDFTQHYDWPARKEQLKRSGQPIPEEGPGLQIFRNGVKYFT